MEFDTQIREIEAEPDLARKALRLAMVVASAFRAIGCETVVVGGSAIEFFTDGDYMSGDVDICFRDRARPELRVIGEVMGRLGAKGSSVRTFQVAGLFVDILGQVETLARTEFRQVVSADGRDSVLIAKPEDLLPERMLVAVYPSRNDEALACVRKLAAACVSGRVEIDWDEAMRVAALPEYRVEKELAQLVADVKRETESDSK